MSEIIEQWRRRIDELDSQILTLLNERMNYAIRIGEEKRKKGQPLFSAEREAEVLKRLIAANSGPLDEQAIRKIFQAILEESLRLEERASSSEDG